jgi:glycosyl transferase, family 25
MKTVEAILIGLIIIAFLLLIKFNLNIRSEKLDYFEPQDESIIHNNNNQFPALYINLEHRQDRKNEIENELQKVGFYNYQRFNAIKNEKGYLGCSESHLECLKLARANNYPNVLILEDDFEFIIDKNEFQFILNHLLTVDYDVFILSYNTYEKNITKTDDQYLKRIKETQTASGYIVNRKYYDKLISNFEEGLRLLRETDIYSKYAVDQYWKPLQSQDKWYCYKKRIGKQRDSYSDIEKGMVSYQV